MVLPTLGTVGAVALGLVAGVAPWQFWLLGIMYVLTLTGVELGFHRYISHQAFVAAKPVRTTLIILGSMAAQGPVLYWAATHRRHHAHSDRDGDPHSPRPRGAGVLAEIAGFCHGHCGWLFNPVQTDWLRFVKDLLGDRLLFNINRTYLLWVFLGLMLPTLVGVAMTHSWLGAMEGLLWGGLMRIFLAHHVVWGVNSLCHRSGSRDFRAKDESRNNILMALPSLGGAWHNNHHAFPFTADNRLAWWQFDFCGSLVRLLGQTGLVRDIRFPTREEMARRRRNPEQSWTLDRRRRG